MGEKVINKLFNAWTLCVTYVPTVSVLNNDFSSRL